MPRRLPLPLRLLPGYLKVPAWSRWYRAADSEWPHLFTDAPLSFAPALTMDLVSGDIISSSIAFTGLYERRLSRYVLDLARRGGMMIDVGANLGYFTLLWAGAGAGNRCRAFEPSSRVVELLRTNVRKNGLASRVEISAVAAGRERGRMAFHQGLGAQTGWGGFSPPNDETVTVDVVRLDEALPDEPVALLKIDAEGADTWVLEGCERLLARRLVAHICYEQNQGRMRHLGIAVGDAERLLKSFGYVVRPFDNQAGDVVEWSAALS